MNDEELQREREALAAPNQWQQMDAALALGRSGDPRAFEIVMEILREPARWFSEVREFAIEGLVVGAPATLPLVIDRYLAAPTAADGESCAYVLGEIAYRSGAARDARIDTALLDGLTRVVAAGTAVAKGTVAALRECARAAPVQAAAPWLWRLVEGSRQEAEPDEWCVQLALEQLRISEGDAAVVRLRALRASLSEEEPLAWVIDEFLSAA